MNRLAMLGFVVLGLLAAVRPTSAASITFTLGTEFSGGQIPSGFPTVTLDDGGGVGAVTVTINTFPMSGTEFLDDIYLNVPVALEATLGTATATNFFGVTPNTVSFAANSFKADGDGFFDILIDYPPPPGNSPNQLGADLVAGFTLNLAGLTALGMNVNSTCGQGCGNGGWPVATHLQGIVGGGSGWLGGTPDGPPPPPPPPPVAEPASLLLLGGGLLAVARQVRRNRQA